MGYLIPSVCSRLLFCPRLVGRDWTTSREEHPGDLEMRCPNFNELLQCKWAVVVLCTSSIYSMSPVCESSHPDKESHFWLGLILLVITQNSTLHTDWLVSSELHLQAKLSIAYSTAAALYLQEQDYMIFELYATSGSDSLYTWREQSVFVISWQITSISWTLTSILRRNK